MVQLILIRLTNISSSPKLSDLDRLKNSKISLILQIFRENLPYPFYSVSFLKWAICSCTIIFDEQLEWVYWTGVSLWRVNLSHTSRSEVHNCNTRNRGRLHIPLCRTAAGQGAFTFRGERLWNSLQDEFQSITNLDVFKVVKIKLHILRVFLEN